MSERSVLLSTRIMRNSIVVIPFIFIIACWSIAVYYGAIDSVFLPSPIQVARSFGALFVNGFLGTHLAPSFLRVTMALALSIVIAFPLGVLSGQIQWLAKLIEPLCSFTRYLPVPALVPLCILWFGIADEQKVAVITIGVVFQLVLLFSADSASVPRELIEAGRTYGLSHFAILTRIVIPASMPSMWNDFRVSAGWAWSYVVLAELVAGNTGVGYFVVQSQRFLETENVFAGVLFIGMLGLLTDLVFRVLYKRFFRWV